MTYDFFKFGDDTFEQFARALASIVLGPGVSGFGKGPDGGREATFSGHVAYPHPPTDEWTGYGVVQAKCKSRTESSAVDQEWALSQLRKELSLFAKSKKRQPKPDYYIFITNVSLSSVAGGGKDQATRILTQVHGAFKLHGHAIWDASQLALFLDRYSELRRRFAAYITPGDVLAKLLQQLSATESVAEAMLTGFLDRELRADASARLDQAGHRIDDQILLSSVFFDLPANDKNVVEPPAEEADAKGQLPSGVMAELLSVGSYRLDPRSVFDGQEEASASDDASDVFNRCVLIGGPGSGKSTLGQFLSQIHRAAMLKCRPQHTLERRTRNLIDSIYESCCRDSLPWPSVPRLPFRIDLNRFAKKLSSSGKAPPGALGHYLLSLVAGSYSPTYQDLADWFRTFPTLLILDGLDEVPASSNRSDMMRAVEEFLAELRHMEADLFVLATTRPQGYSNEFHNDEVRVRYVLPLSPARAIDYAKRYSQARFGDNLIERERIIEQLAVSAEHHLTQRLMRSPLQVTFMATVVAARGTPGDNRWQLFSSYYRTIYDRELQKAVPPYNQVLGAHQATIERLHHDIGFLLQARGEGKGGTDASIAIADFEKMVRRALDGDGWKGADAEKLVATITDAARTRLVFLTSRIEDQLSFDVRSLQEYMAGECLMTGDSDVVLERLRVCRASAYWRNVLLFTFGKAFADAHSRHHKQSMQLLCDDRANCDDELECLTGIGPFLALDVLDSGAVAQHPAAEKHLINLALETLDFFELETFRLPDADSRLAALYRREFQVQYNAAIESRLVQKGTIAATTSWGLLLILIRRRISWAIEVAERYWPEEVAEQNLILVNATNDNRMSSWLGTKIAENLHTLSPHEIDHMPLLEGHRRRLPKTLAHCAFAFRRPYSSTHTAQFYSLTFDGTPSKSIRVGLNSCLSKKGQSPEEGLRSLKGREGLHRDWLPYIAADELTCDPCENVLHQVCRDLLAHNFSDINYYLPWQINSVLDAASDIGADEALTNVLEGRFGTRPVWLDAERHWRKFGVDVSHIFNTTSTEQLLSDGLRSLFPFTRCLIRLDRQVNSEGDAAEFKSIIERLPSNRRWRWIRLLMQAAGPQNDLATLITPSALRGLIEGVRTDSLSFSLSDVMPTSENLTSEWIDFLEWCGDANRLVYNYFAPGERNLDEQRRIIAQSFERAPNRQGLLKVLAALFYGDCNGKDYPVVSLELASTNDDALVLATIILALTADGLTDEMAKTLATRCRELPFEKVGNQSVRSVLANLVGWHVRRLPSLAAFNLAFAFRAGGRHPLCGMTFVDNLDSYVRARQSDLQLPAVRNNLKLPC